MRDNRLRWLGHVFKREETVRLVKEIYVEGKRRR